VTSTVESQNHGQRTLTGTHVAIIGVGTMGAAMARRLLGADATVDVWNRSPEPSHALTPRGARVTPTGTGRSVGRRWW